MHTRLLTPLFFGLVAASLAGCGDSGSDTDTTTTTMPGPTTDGPTTGTDVPTTTGDAPSTTTGDDPVTTTGDDPVPTTTGDDTTGEPVGCNVSPEGDEDSDGVDNASDNCPCDANPNQLDFDGNGVGNVCDEDLVHTIADGTPPEFNSLVSEATAQQAIFSCKFPVTLIAIGGELRLRLDDEGQAQVYMHRVDFADTPELTCDLGLITVKLRLEEFYGDGVDPFAVGFGFSLEDHKSGEISGMTGTPHAVMIGGTINVTESSNPDLAMPGANDIEGVPGNFPVAVATATNTANNLALQFEDTDSVVFQQTTESGVEITLRGMTGTFRLRK